MVTVQRSDLAGIVDTALELPVVTSFTRLGYDLRSRLAGWTPLDRYDLSGRTVLVTGATSGLGLSGTYAGGKFDMVVTKGTCSDGMSDRQYPFTVTLEVGSETRFGCARTETHPFTGPARP